MVQIHSPDRVKNCRSHIDLGGNNFLFKFHYLSGLQSRLLPWRIAHRMRLACPDKGQAGVRSRSFQTRRSEMK